MPCPRTNNRKQTIAGGERTTPALKEYEEKYWARTSEFSPASWSCSSAALRVAAESPRIQESARALSSLDVLAALAETAAVANYTKPHVHDGDDYLVADGRHPVVERYAALVRSCPTTSISTAPPASW